MKKFNGTVQEAIAAGAVDRLKDREVLFCLDGYVEAVWDAAAEIWRYPTTWGSVRDEQLRIDDLAAQIKKEGK